MSIIGRNRQLWLSADKGERRRLPIMMKIFLGFFAILAFVLIGNMVFLHQLSRLNRIIKSTSNGMYRIVLAQDMRKSLRQVNRNRGVYHNTPSITIKDAERSLTGFSGDLESEMKRLSGKLGRDIAPIERINDMVGVFARKGGVALEYVKQDSIDIAYNIIRSDTFVALCKDIHEEIDKANKRYNLRIMPNDFGNVKSTLEITILSAYYRYRFYAWNDSLEMATDSLALLLGTRDTTGKVLSQYVDSLAVIFERERTLGVRDSAAWETASSRITTPLEEILSSEVAGVSQTFRESQLAVAVTRTIGVWGAVGLFGLGMLIAIFISRKIAAPIADLRRATHSASKGEWDKLITPSTNDEIGDLTEDFNKMLRELGELDVMKSRFLASITHDLKSPIGRVRGNIANLQDGLLGPVNEGQNELLDMMSKDVDKLSRLIHDILDLQKMKAGAFKLDLAEVELKPFILSILEQHAQVLLDKEIELGVKLDLGKTKIYLDKKQIERVFDNLVVNAIKYTSGGGRIIIESNIEGAEVLFKVIDTGVGIPAEHVEHVFDEFYQAGQKVKGVKGTGLGLTIVKQIVEAHGGRIWVDSKPKVGTVFAFRIPIERPN